MGEQKQEEEAGFQSQSHPIFIPASWSEAADSIAYDSSSSPPPIAFICGPKNSGKTTFSRQLLNTLLNRYRKVAYLDTDVGQPEFTTPGCLSLHLIDEQILDLTILTLKTPERYVLKTPVGNGVQSYKDYCKMINKPWRITFTMTSMWQVDIYERRMGGFFDPLAQRAIFQRPPKCLFFGDTSSKRDPETYLNNIFHLYNYFRMKFYQSNEHELPGNTQLPLVINTAGWVKGVGYDLLVEMLKYIAPTHVVQIRISTEDKNLPIGAFWSDGNKKGQVNLIEINAALRNSSNRSMLIRKDGRLLRDARIIGYFRQCFPSDMNITTNKELADALASHPPYEVPISKTKVMHLHCQVPSSEIFHSLNATIVGLAVSSRKPSESESCAPWCIGLGLVRGVNISKDLLYVITPVRRCNLENVDTLLQGFIDIPACLLQVRGCMSPYMSADVLPAN